MVLTMTFDRWLALIGLLFGIISCGLAIYFFRRSEKKRIPTFIVRPRRQLLVLPELTQLGAFSVSFGDLQVGLSGVTSAQIHFWNRGTLPILQADVLKPFVIRVGANILCYSIVKSSREVISPEIHLSHHPSLNEVDLNFSVLEAGDGLTIQIVYDGPSGTAIEFDGACVGVPKPEVLASDDLYFKTRSARLLESYMPLLVSLIISGVVLPVGGGALWLIARLFGEHVETIAIVVVLGSLFAVSLVVILLGHIRRIATAYIPPDIRP